MENVGTIREFKAAANESFGVAALEGQWDQLMPKYTAISAWFALALSGRLVDSLGNVTSVVYKVADQVVCLPAWAAMRGVPPATAQTIDRAVRAGDVTWNDGTAKTARTEALRRRGTLQAAATTWWTERLGWYDMITKRGVILHPRDVEWKRVSSSRLRRRPPSAKRPRPMHTRPFPVAPAAPRPRPIAAQPAQGQFHARLTICTSTRSQVYTEEFVPEMRLLGYNWKLPPQGSPDADQQDDELDEDDDGSEGSMPSWYRGRKEALRLLAIQKYGPNAAPFQFKSRAKHSAYKECADCQTLRLAITEAIRRRESPDIIKARKQEYNNHLQVMYAQRRKLEQITQMAGHEGLIVENSDKCGDDCLYLPNSSRASSANVSKYKYRLSLQANIYAGKLYHLMLLLPNLTTGADFGVTSFLSGLTRLFQLGRVTNQTRRLLRGMDGGSENVNFVSLGMNSTLVHELHRGSIDEIQQHRLPPDHSHYHVTDGTFSVLEGWLCHDGFPGCPTVWDLIDYLRSKFSTAANYKNKRIEITCLLVTFAFEKWFDGCIHQDKIRRIGTPLVWRHKWNEEQQEVVVQYKMLLSDEGCFEKDEWGPWEERFVQHNNPETGRVELVKVLRSDPAGVRLMKSYPNISVDPGVTPWKDDSAWKREKVFADLARWEYSQLQSDAAQVAASKWGALSRWHQSHPTSDTIVVGAPIAISNDLELRTPLLSWPEMWNVLKTHISAPAQLTSAAPAVAGPSTSRKRRANRDALSASTSAALVNVVTHPGYTEKDRRTALLKDHELGADYVLDNISTDGTLFLIKLQHPEGEFAVGLGRRTFNDDMDGETAQAFEIEWFERKNKKVASWGKQPGFRPAVESYDAQRKPRIMCSVEQICDFLPVAVKVTPATEGSDEPSLSQDCMLALREYLGEGEAGEEGEGEEASKKRPRKG